MVCGAQRYSPDLWRYGYPFSKPVLACCHQITIRSTNIIFLLVHEVIYVVRMVVNLNNDLKQYDNDDFYHELNSRTT